MTGSSLFRSHNRRGSGQRHRKRHQSSRFARIKRHFSQTNIDDFSSPNDSPRLPDRETYTRPKSVLEKSSNLARSESNLLEKVCITPSNLFSMFDPPTFSNAIRLLMILHTIVRNSFIPHIRLQNMIYNSLYYIILC